MARAYSMDLRERVVAAGLGLLCGAVALLFEKLIGLFTNALFFHRLSLVFLEPTALPRSWVVAVVPAVGGLIVGIVENLAAGFLDPYVGGGTKDFAPYVLMILVLMIRPYGLFGKVDIERV